MTLYRVYDPLIGRWWQQDPLSDLPQQIAQSPYQYGWNNPLRYNDPNGDCPCIIPAIPWIAGALEALFTATALGTAGYLAYEEFGPDYSNLRTGTREIYNEGSSLNNSDPKNPNFNNFKKAAVIGTAIALAARLIEKNAKFFGVDPRELENALTNMGESDLQFFIENARGLLRSGENELTDRQFFGLINPALVNAASVYNAQKDIYSLERGLSQEQKAAEREESNKGKKANELLNNFSNAAQGTYIWNGTDWVIEE